MRIQVILLLIFLSSNLTSSAQKPSFIAGASISTMKVEYTFQGTQYSYQDNFSSRIGYHFGLLYEKPVKLKITESMSAVKNITWESGLVYTTKGYHQDLDEFFVGDDPVTGFNRYTSVTEKVNLNYLHLPLVVKYHLKNPNLHVVTGIVVDIGLGGKIQYLDIEDSKQEYHSLKVVWGDAPAPDKELWGTAVDDAWFGYEGDQIKRLDMGLVLGAGTSDDFCTLNVRYIQGLSNISATSSFQALVKNRVLMLSIICYPFQNEI